MRILLRRPLPAAALLILALSQGGCSIFSPLPAWELVKATGSAVSTGVASYGPSQATQTVYHPHAPVTQLCIELNRSSPVEDLVPVLIKELKAYGIEGRVYDTGTPVTLCDTWLRYAASIDWGVPPMGNDYKPFMSAASLSLQRSDGRLLASSRYVLDDAGFASGKWAPTQHKLQPVVKALITGVENQ